MDLGHCPRCGTDWIIGDERCRACGYTAIGAGLSRLPKKKPRKIKKYVEPGGSGGFLSVTAVAVVFWGVFYYQPWANDWDLIRALLGVPHHFSIIGDWRIVETITPSRGAKDMYSAGVVNTGTMSFDQGDVVKITLTNSYGEIDAQGNFEFVGTHLKIYNIKKTGPRSTKFPKDVGMDIAWNGSDKFEATIGPNDVLKVARNKKPMADELIHSLVSNESSEMSDDVRGKLSSAKGGGGEEE